MKFRITLLLLMVVVCLTSCRKKCNDPAALNDDALLFGSEDNCRYSTVAFYANQAVAQFTVSVEGQVIGSSGIYYPWGPGNCSATGTVSYDFGSGEKVDWNAMIITLSGMTFFTNGTIEPSSFNECILVNVTL